MPQRALRSASGTLPEELLSLDHAAGGDVAAGEGYFQLAGLKSAIKPLPPE